MRKNMLYKKISFALILAFLLLTGGLPASAADKGVATLNYDQVQELLKENKGKIVMINFFATWCPPCVKEIPSLIKIRKSYGEDKLLLIGASVDEDAGALRAFMAKTKFNYPIRKAAPDLVYAASVEGIPHMLVFDGKGEVILNAAGLVPEEALREFINTHLETK